MMSDDTPKKLRRCRVTPAKYENTCLPHPCQVLGIFLSVLSLQCKVITSCVNLSSADCQRECASFHMFKGLLDLSVQFGGNKT